MEGPQVLEYYQARVAAFDSERADLLARLDACTTGQKELYRLRLDNRSRTEEVRELQKVWGGCCRHAAAWRPQFCSCLIKPHVHLCCCRR